MAVGLTFESGYRFGIRSKGRFKFIFRSRFRVRSRFRSGVRFRFRIRFLLRLIYSTRFNSGPTCSLNTGSRFRFGFTCRL